MLTPDTRPEWTNQQIFDAVVEHLGKQRERAVNSGTCGPSCLYLTEDGKRCAVGALMRDDVDAKRIFGTVECEHVQDALKFNPSPDNVRLLSALQIVHDQQIVDKWPGKLSSVGLDFGLDTDRVAEAFDVQR